MNKRSEGSIKEDLACEYLKKQNVKILQRNFYSSHGEIDIIGKDKDYLVFFEVKYRKTNVYGNPLEAVNYKKQRNIVNAARFFLYKYKYPENTFVRFDCIGITANDIRWVKNAFSC
ncbi:MAG: YraN family protein [Lachnospiraceae bacterium]|nr:YraN family protein [Lachnospiraceae bacterium]